MNCVVVLCTLSPAYAAYEESVSTLCFAMRAKSVVLSPSKNEAAQIDGAFISFYGKQIADIEKKLKKLDTSSTGEKGKESRERLQEKLDQLRSTILVSGDLDLTCTEEPDRSATGGFGEQAASEPLRDMTEEMERQLRMSATIERRYKRVLERRRLLESKLDRRLVGSKVKDADKGGEFPWNEADLLSKTTVQKQKKLAETLGLEEGEAEDQEDAKAPSQNKEREKELRDVLISSENKFFDELVSDYVKQMHVIAPDNDRGIGNAAGDEGAGNCEEVAAGGER